MDVKGGAQVALQDGLLSFQIKETVFLSSDKAGIGELKELELVPDVEIIENPQEVSITGCLQLFGKYDPYQEKTEEENGEADTLVAAMKFTPFQMEEPQAGFLASAEQTLSHRVPLNISIPLNRVDDLGDIYAIVDSFDYQLESPNQLLIHAHLKIAGIQLRDQDNEQQEEPEEAWEFVHSVGQEEPEIEHTSLEEIERKLAALEEEILAQEKQEQTPPPAAPNVFIASEANPHKRQAANVHEPMGIAQPVNAPLSSGQPLYGDLSPTHSEPEPEIEASTYTTGSQKLEIAPAQYAEEWNKDVTAQAFAKEAQEQNVQFVGEPAGTNEAEAEPVMAAEEAEAVFAEQPSVEPQEMRVAIGSKNTEEKEAKVNITSLFTQGKRSVPPQAAGEAESSSSSSRRSAEAELERSEAMNNLTSFVRQTEERMSKVRIAIIQRNETIESIADRYKLPVSRILEANKVTSDRITEGQILYIPQ